MKNLKTKLLCTVAAAALIAPSVATASSPFLWIQELNSPGLDYSTGTCTDNKGAVIVLGRQAKNAVGFAAKFDSMGGLVWKKNAPAAETPLECTTDALGNVYTVDKLYVKKLAAANGALIWRKQPIPNLANKALGYTDIAGTTNGTLWINGTFVLANCVNVCPSGTYTTPTKVAVRLSTTTGAINGGGRIAGAKDIATNRYGDLFTIGATKHLATPREEGWEPAKWRMDCTPQTVEMWFTNSTPAWRQCLDNDKVHMRVAAGYDGEGYVLSYYAQAGRVDYAVTKYNHVSSAEMWLKWLTVPQSMSYYGEGLAVNKYAVGNIVTTISRGNLFKGAPSQAPTTEIAYLSPAGVLVWTKSTTRLTDANTFGKGAPSASLGRDAEYFAGAQADIVVGKF